MVFCNITPPVIYHENITNANEGENISIFATITDDTKVASATLFYRITSEEAWTSSSMIPTGNIYSATIPASNVTTAGVQYYIAAVGDALNTAYSPATAPEKPYSIAVTVINTSTVTIFTTSTINSSEIISGNIIPACNATVTLTFTSPTVSILERTTTSAISGCYHFLFTTNEEEKWCVNATWAGDSDTAGNTSETVSFTVNKSKVNVGYAIIIAGRTDDDLSHRAINISATNAYDVLSTRGFTRERIFYLNPSSRQSVNRTSSLENITYAINTWANDSVSANDSLLIYMVGHAEKEAFIVNGANETLNATYLNKSLNKLTNNTKCHYITVVYDASHSGSFIDNLSRCGRIIVTSVDNDTKAEYDNEDGVVFSKYFFNSISSGKTIKEAFENVSKYFIDQTFPDLTPRLDDNGDGIGHGIRKSEDKLEDDGSLAAYKYIGSQVGSIDFSPTITSAIQNKNKTYNYTIRTGSYPKIPAIRLEGVCL
jgi:hypothetical protein